MAAVLVLGLHQAEAQTAQNEERLLEELRMNSSLNTLPLIATQGDGNLAETYQEGSSNNSFVQQVQTSQIANQASVLQVGNLNQVVVRQQGAGLSTAVSQYGNNNSYEGSLNGSNISSEVVQDGSGNAINQYLRGNNLDYSLIQLGNNNTIHQIETAPGAGSYQVVQEGNNMHITIEQGRTFVPVNVQRQ
ncbi:hypothetical protein CA264_02335 [Pontibacter actiniarum]|uniref:Curlin n=1 Tax=Pontibacter actiniarum TaxID=323450 RepID=A0A1X9YNA5_9BACT|nr:hypothetical protein CA264_02335 [Pontibacter actiniarum]